MNIYIVYIQKRNQITADFLRDYVLEFYHQSSRWLPLLWPKIGKTLDHYFFFIFWRTHRYIKINSRIWFSPVNKHFHFVDCIMPAYMLNFGHTVNNNVILWSFLYIQTWFYEANNKAEIGKRKYWIYYKKGIVTVKTVKSGIKKTEFRFKAEKNQVCI